jgi:hypothetical protein
VKTFVLIHRHAPAECVVAYAAWSGFDSPLRGRTVKSTCARFAPGRRLDTVDGALQHETWWTVEALDPAAALSQLPPYVRERTQAREVSEVAIQ